MSGEMQQRLRHADALPVTARQRSDRRHGPVRQSGTTHRTGNGGVAPGGGDSVQRGLVVKIFEHCHFRPQRTIFRQITDAPADGGGFRTHFLAVDEYPASGRFEVGRHHLHDGGFAGPVVAEQSDDFAASDTEADVIDGEQVAITPGQLLCLDHARSPSLRSEDNPVSRRRLARTTTAGAGCFAFMIFSFPDRCQGRTHVEFEKNATEKLKKHLRVPPGIRRNRPFNYSYLPKNAAFGRELEHYAALPPRGGFRDRPIRAAAPRRNQRKAETGNSPRGKFALQVFLAQGPVGKRTKTRSSLFAPS